MTMSMRGEIMQEILILGAGFSCIDIIKSGNVAKYNIGGTAANVVSILSQLGMKTYLLVPRYNDQYAGLFSKELQRRKVHVIEFKHSTFATPRVIEHCDDSGNHFFETRCSECGKYLSKVSLPSSANIQKLENHIWQDLNVFFLDRISDGIKLGIQKARDSHAWVFYEPNCCRQFKSFYNNIAQADIIKFSEEIISQNYIDRIASDLNENSKTKLIIISQGHNGLKYSLKAQDGTFGEWVHLKPCQIDNIVDTSGAGDWLAASFLWNFLRTFPKAQDYLPPDIIKQLLTDSQIIAAYSCLYLGAQGIFSVPAGTAFLRNRFNREIDVLPPIVLDSLDGHLCKNCLSPL